MSTLFEKWRPNTFAEVVGQTKAVAVLRRFIERGTLSGRAYWIAGPSGTGKSSLARLIALEVADPFNVEEVDATGLSAAAIQEIERQSYCRGLGAKPGRAYCLNEAHGLNKAAVRQLLTTLERIPKHCVWIFTTTDAGQALFDGIDTNPLLSRCVKLPMARFGLAEAFAVRAKQIAEQECLDGKPIEQYIALVREQKLNFRSVLQAIESGLMLSDDA